VEDIVATSRTEYNNNKRGNMNTGRSYRSSFRSNLRSVNMKPYEEYSKNDKLINETVKAK
jgi:hypothetical protein